MIRVGIIGFGKMGRIRYEVVSHNGLGKVVAVADSVPVDIAQVRIYSRPEDLIADPAVDAVFICTPNYLNQPLTLRALKAGKHVFCEKPPAFDARGVEQVMAAESQAPRQKLMFGFNHRHHDSMIKAKNLIDSGVYGRVLWMRGRYGKSVDKDFLQDWRAKRELAGGGIMIDQGIHLLDLFLMMVGDFEEVFATISNLYWKLDIEDNVFAIFRNCDGVVASLHSTMTQWRHLFSLEIFLEKGYLVINGLLTNSGSYGQEVLTIAKNRSSAPAATWSDEEHITYDINNSWRYEVEHFLSAIDLGSAIQVGTSQDALKLMRLIDKIYSQERRLAGAVQ